MSYGTSADVLPSSFICLVWWCFWLKSQRRQRDSSLSRLMTAAKEHSVKHTYLLSTDSLSIRQISCFSGLNDQAVWCHKEKPTYLKTCSLVYQHCSRGQRTMVIQGDVSVCIEGSMQPQRPRRISLRGTTWRLLSNYKPTQMLDEHRGQGCILTMNSQKCFLLQHYLTLNYIQNYVQRTWHTHDTYDSTITWQS